MKLNYPPLHFTRPELSALAAKAQAGDSDAFVLLIRGTIALYWSTAQQVAKRSDYHYDMVQDAILHTWRCVLPTYDPALSWTALVKRCIRTRMSLYRRMAAGPVTNTQTRVPLQHAAPLPAAARGIADPDQCRTPLVMHTPSAFDVLADHERLSRLQIELDRLQPIERDSVLEVQTVAAQRHGKSHQRISQLSLTVKAKLKQRLHDLHP